MNKIYLFIYLSICFISFQNQKQTISVYFNEESPEKFLSDEGQNLSFFEKIQQKNETIFIIQDEYFFLKKGQKKVCVASIEEIQFTSIEDVKKDIHKNKYIFKSEIYEKIYLYEVINKNKYIKHEVELLYFEK